MVNTAQGTYTLRQKQLGKDDSVTWRVGQHPLASTVASVWCHFLIECSLSNPGGGHSYHSCSTDEETPKPRKVLASSIPQSLRVSAGLKARCCPLGHMPQCWHFVAELSPCFVADWQSRGDLITQRGVLPSQSREFFLLNAEQQYL